MLGLQDYDRCKETEKSVDASSVARLELQAMKSSINKFLVVLDEPRVFSPGEHVHGKVVLDVKQEIKLWKLNLECRGEVYVSWPENNGTYTRYRFGREELFDVKACVYGATEEKPSKTSSPSVLKPSVYSFSFRFTIPSIELPSSYEGKHGYIRYWMQASIEKKNGKSELKTTENVFDIGGYDEYDEEELEDMKNYDMKYSNTRNTSMPIKGSCRRSESLRISARTDRSLYHPGEVINTHITTDNEAYRGTRAVEVSLVMLTVYDDGKNNQTTSKQEVVRAEKDFKEDAGAHHVDLVIPSKSLYPTMVRGCQLIKVTYYVQVRLKVNGKIQREPNVMIPVVIVPSPVLPPLTKPAESHSDSQKDDVRSNSVSNVNPGTLFYVTGSPYGNKWAISTGLFYANKQHRSRRVPRVTHMDEDDFAAFYCHSNGPTMSYV